MDPQIPEYTSDEDMNEFISCIELETVRSLVSKKFINLVCKCNQSQVSDATTVLQQLVLMNEAVKSAMKVGLCFIEK